MLAIEAATVVGGSFDSASHLQLEKHDGTLVDAGTPPDATEAAKGIVELASSAEVIAGTDALRVVTPAGLAAIPGNKVQNLTANSIAESAIYSAYPTGVSIMSLTTGSSWSLASGFGTVLTINIDMDRCTQVFYARAGGATGLCRSWTRSYHSTDNGGGWTTWQQQMVMPTINPTGVTQSIPVGNYPQGMCRIYFTSAQSTGWDFAGKAGEVVTYYDGVDYAKQTWTSHASGSSNKPETWIRTGNIASGWSAWTVVANPGEWTSYTPTWTASTNPTVGNGTLIGRYFRVGRTITFQINLTMGSTTTYGSGNYDFALPVLAANVGTHHVGNVHVLAGPRYFGHVLVSPAGTTTSPFLANTSSQLVAMAQGTPVTLASGNQIRITGVYEAAS
jgi:hypothetical protein